MGALVIGLAAAGSAGPVGVLFAGASTGILGLGFAAAAGAQGMQRTADHAAFGGPSPFLVFPATGLLSIFLTFLLSALSALLQFTLSSQVVLLLTVLVNALVAVGLVRLLVVGPGALTWAEMGFRRPGPDEGSVIRDVGWGIGLAVPAFVAGLAIAVVLTMLMGVLPEGVIPMTNRPDGLLLNVVAAVAVAPLWEETFFRGYATTAWARGLSVQAAVVRGALFFAAIHVLGVAGPDFASAAKLAAIAFVIRLPVGLLLGWVLLRRRTLIAPVALHAAYNAIPILLFVAMGTSVGA